MNKKDWLVYIIIIISIIVIRTFVITTIKVSGISMENTLNDKDIMFMEKITKVKRFDIVGISVNDELLIKRVIGIEGDLLYYKDNKLFINNKEVKEDYTKGITKDFHIEEFGVATIPKNHYLVLGDNRENSNDSRAFGLITKNNIIGKANIKIYPFK